MNLPPETETPNASRPTMAGKPVFVRPAKTILNMDSGFKPKLLCDGPTFSTGDACVYSCLYCYVPDIMRKAAYMPGIVPHADSVVRRENALEILERQLTLPAKGGKRKPKYDNANDTRIVYASPLVDIAPNGELMRETGEACILILKLTNWRIRLLSKSAALFRLAKYIGDQVGADEVRRRIIFGASAGTLDDKLAASFELKTPLVSKRIADIIRLQDEGYQTFGMICPSLPQRDPKRFSEEMYFALRAWNMPDVWAEVINVRGENMTKTVAALRAAGYEWEASALQETAEDPATWEHNSRITFESHAAIFPGRLRFLQYVTKANSEYWTSKVPAGAVLL